MNANVNKNSQVMTSEAVLLSTYVNTVSTVCELDKGIVSANFDVVNSNTWNENERLISLPMAVYISEHFNAMFVGIVFNFDGARDTFGQAIDTEMLLDEMAPETRARERARMSNSRVADKSHAVEMGVSNYNSQILAAFMDNLSKSHAKFGPNFSRIFEEKVNALTEEDKMILSFIFSNFIYIIRAFNNNGMFVDKVIDVVTRVEAQYCK